MKLVPYPKYKPSGVEWLGDVPEHWKMKRLKHLASINDETLSEATDPAFEMSYVDIGSVDTIEGIVNVEGTTFENAPSRARRIVRDGDTIVSTVRTYLKAIAHIQKPKPNTIVSTGFAVIRPRTTNPAFLSYALRETGFVETIVARSVGVSYPAVNASEIGSIEIPLPPNEEQRAIADFLDREAVKIDTLIDKKKTLIERLQEKRAALITRTVTRGLPPDAARAAGLESEPKMKASGVEWLGDVPAHWEVKRGRFCVEVQPSSNRLRELSLDNEVSFVPMEAVGEYGGLDLEQTRAVAERGSGYTEFEDGDVIVAKITPCFENGKGALASGLLNGAAIGTTELHVLRPRSNLDRRLLFYFTISPLFRTLGEGEMYGAGGQKRVPTSFCEDVPIPLAPLDEQRAIADFLDRETAKIDGLVAKVETAIARLREYRAALITAAVTGQVDVRGGRSLSLSKGRGRVWR